MKRTIAAGMMALAAVFGAVAPAVAKLPTTTIEEYDRKTDTDKGEVVRLALNAFYDLYANQKHDQAKAACILALYKSKDGKSIPDGYVDLDIALKQLRISTSTSRPSVERVIFNIINEKCPTTVVSNPAPPPPG